MCHCSIAKLVIVGCHVRVVVGKWITSRQCPIIASRMIMWSLWLLRQLILQIVNLLFEIPNSLIVNDNSRVLQLIYLPISRLDFGPEMVNLSIRLLGLAPLFLLQLVEQISKVVSTDTSLNSAVDGVMEGARARVVIVGMKDRVFRRRCSTPAKSSGR